MDWTDARKSGVGVSITSADMWNEYKEWLQEQCCEECGSKYADKLPWKCWVTETLCCQCWLPGRDDDIPDEFLTKEVKAQKYAWQVRQRNPHVRAWLEGVLVGKFTVGS